MNKFIYIINEDKKIRSSTVYYSALSLSFSCEFYRLQWHPLMALIKEKYYMTYHYYYFCYLF